MRATPTETLQRRQQCHDLHAEGRTYRQIQEVLNVGRATIRDWLNRGRPTDEEIAEAAPANAIALPVETLQNRQRCHDLHQGGASQRELQQDLNVSSATVRDWLSRPRPTDEDVAAARDGHFNPKTDNTGQVGFKSRFDPDLFAELRAEAERQGAATNKVLGCAARLYLDCMSRARAGGGEPVSVLGWRA
jgi:transposase